MVSNLEVFFFSFVITFYVVPHVVGAAREPKIYIEFRKYSCVRITDSELYLVPVQSCWNGAGIC